MNPRTTNQRQGCLRNAPTLFSASSCVPLACRRAQGANYGARSLAITNATAAPFFKAGTTSVAQWRSSIRALQAPWAELASDKIVITVPSKVGCRR